MRKSAIIFGATGLIGGHLLRQLLDNPVYGKIIAVVRRDIGITHPKLHQLIADLQALNTIEAELIGDDVFCCLGTTRKRTPDLTDYYQVDHDYPVAIASITKGNGASAFMLVSAVGANPDSSNFYLRIKGEAERDIRAVGFESLHIFRPSLLTGKRHEQRWTERVSEKVLWAINPLLVGSLTRYRSIPAASVAAAMNSIAQREAKGTHIYYWNHINMLA
ncbi:oxidoreductase [Parapedobacter defluvii]|uniref:oxidoreductase n=1 Tax=Parapedobacter defluvii TaxID=2045106 RepID=UPI00333EB711